MKKHTKRMLCLAMVLLMLLALTPMARAATVTWIEDSKPCSATVERIEGTYTVSVAIEDAGYVDHEAGEEEIITWPTGYRATQEPEYTPPNVRSKIYVEQARELEGLSMDSMSSAAPAKDYYVLDPDLPEGRYSYGSVFTVYDASWQVTIGQLSGRAVTLEGATSGLIKGFPVSCTAPKLIVLPVE